MKLSTIIEAFLSGIEDDSDFQSFCLSRFGCRIQRAPEAVSLSDQTTERLTHLPAFPEDWDNTAWNRPVHFFVTIPAQEFNDETDNYQCSDYNTVFQMMLRFDTTVDITDIYDCVDQLRICLRAIDTAGYAPNYRGINPEFIYVENQFPAVRCEVVADSRLSDVNDKETS